MTSTNYVPARYEVEGIIRSNDIEAAGAIYEYLYHVKKNNPERILHIYWYEGIGYAENAEDYPITSEGYAHATEFNGFFSENDLGGLVWQIKELSKNFNWAADLSSDLGDYKDANEECSVELKIDSVEDDTEKLA